MTTRTMRTMTLAAGFAWLVVGGYGVWSATVDDDTDWEPTYMVFSLALLVGAALGVAAAAFATRHTDRRQLRTAGLALSSLGGVACLVAWALPLWMTVLGVGFAMLAAASGPSQRRPLALLAAGQLVGIVVMFLGIAAEVGRRDEWGDYPAAGGIALVVVAATTIVALFAVTRSMGLEPAPGETGRALEVNSIA